MGGTVGFTHPWYLALLLALPAFVLLARRRRRVPRRSGPVVLGLRLGVALCLVLAVAGPRVPAPARGVATVFVLDQSDSVPADVRETAKYWVRQALAEQGPDDLAGAVTFGRDARVELPLGTHRDHPRWGEPPAGDGSDVGAALALAADLLPPAGSGPLRRLVLLSDGNETRGDALRALLRPQLWDVEVAVLPLPQRLQDTAITGFVAPPALRQGEPAELRLAIASPTTQPGHLRVWANEHLVADQTVDLENGPTDVVVDAGALGQGFWAFHATLDVPEDSRPENNQSWAYTVVGPPARVLLVEGRPGAADAVRQALADAGVPVDAVDPGGLPADLEGLSAYDAILLANVPAGALGGGKMPALQQAVAARGKGLVVLGGDQTFGLGGYAGTPLEAVLPVTVQPPDRDRVAGLALVLVIDRSGSMATSDTAGHRATRLDLAKEGAIQAVQTLRPGDQAGVLAFDTSAEWITPLQTLSGPQDLQAVADRIATIQVGGGTDFYEPLNAAYRALQQTPARIKHVIFMTDGEAPETRLPPLLAAMRQAGITVSTLGVSGDISGSGRAVLERLARAGQGRSSFTDTADDVPRIMTQEARLAGQSDKRERDFQPRLVTAAPAVRGLVPSELPPLHGYVRTAPKREAEVVLGSDQQEPILAQWQDGLGRAVAWTTDAQGPWSRDWAGAAPFQRLWPQAVRWTMPAPTNPTLRVAVRRDGDQAVVRVEARTPDGAFRNLLPTAADVSFPDGRGRHLPLLQTAPGHYEGQFPLTGPGVYALQVTQTDDGGAVVATETTGYALPYLPEYALTPANRSLLERLAADTGGPTLNHPADAWRRDPGHAWEPQDVWREALAAALVLFVADVALRRLRLGVPDARAAGARLRRGAGAWPPRYWPRGRATLHPLLQAARRR